ncbi:hypothetical protein D1007_51454 [Hordeum vulgare]|nr:hypothetical protein D1007_51454 [Hordeum vulgare]
MPSQKRLREVSSEQAAELEDDVVHAEKHDYTKVLNEVEAHGKEPLYVVCTSNPEVADEMIKKMRMKLGGMFDRIIGVDVEYTREDEPNQRAAVLQLCLEEMVLVFHITATTKITQDWRSNPDKFIDMRKKWRHPYIDKPYDSLADVASMVVHPFYKHMKQKINHNKDHKLWGIAPLPDHIIQYAAIDAYATYKAWKTIDIVIKGLYRLNYDEKFGTVYNY